PFRVPVGAQADAVAAERVEEDLRLRVPDHLRQLNQRPTGDLGERLRIGRPGDLGDVKQILVYVPHHKPMNGTPPKPSAWGTPAPHTPRSTLSMGDSS